MMKEQKSKTHTNLFWKTVFPILFFIILIIAVFYVILPNYKTLFSNVNEGNAPVSLEYIQSNPPVSSPVPQKNIPNVESEEKPETAATENISEINYQSSTYASLSLNDNHPSVEKLQLRLMELGYLESDEPGTIYNEATQNAVEMFQRAASTEISGIADVETQELLFDDNATYYEVKSGSYGNDIKSMQNQLSSLGYYTSKINGYFGTATEDALISFQKKNNLSKDGIYNIDDRDLLYSENAKPFIDVTPSPEPVKKEKKKKQKKQNPPVVKDSSPDTDSVVVIYDDVPVYEELEKPEEKTEPVIRKSFSATGDVEGVISCAEAQLGKKYVGGDEGPDTFDCSGLVYYCLKQNGVSIKRRSAASYAETSSWELIESKSDLIRGDLMFFKNDSSSRVSHTAIYIGNGMMIDASSSNGKVVKRSCTTPYWVRNFVCGRRVF